MHRLPYFNQYIIALSTKHNTMLGATRCAANSTVWFARSEYKFYSTRFHVVLLHAGGVPGISEKGAVLVK